MAEKKVGYTIEWNSKGAKAAAADAKLVAGSMEDLVAKLNRADFKTTPKVVSELEAALRGADFKRGFGDLANSAEAAAKTATDSTKQAAYQSKQLAFQLNDVVAQLSTGTPAWRILAQQGGQVTQIYGGIGATFSALLPKIVSFAPAIAAAAAGVAAMRGVSMGREAAKSITELADTADRAKVSVENLQKFVAAGAGKGVSADQIASGLTAVSKAGLKAADDQKQYYQDLETAQANVGKGIAGAREELAKLEAKKPGDIFTQLGQSMAGFNGRADESIPIIRRVADRLAAMPEGIQKTKFLRLAEDTFGDGFTKVLAGGSKAIDEYDKKLDALVPKLTAPQIAAAKANLSLSGLLDAAKKRAEDQLGAAFIPAANALDKYLLSTFRTNSQAIKDFADQVRAFFEILNGNTEEAARNPALALIANGYTGLVKVVKGLKDVAVTSFSFFAEKANDAFRSVNALLGTNWDAGSAALIASITAIVTKFKPVQALIGAMSLQFLGLAAVVGAAALVVYSYGDKIKAKADTFYRDTVLPAQIRNAQAVAEQDRARGNFAGAEVAEKRANDLLQKRAALLEEARKDAEKAKQDAKYAGLSAGEEFLARVDDSLSNIGSVGSKIWAKLTGGAEIAGQTAGQKIGDGIATGAASGARAANAELDRVEKAANAAEGRIIKAGNVTSVVIPKDGQPSEPRLVKRAAVSAIDTAARTVDKPGLEGIDNAIGLGKIALDQIERVSTKKKELTQPAAISLDSAQVDQASQKLQKADDAKKSIEGRIIRGGTVTPTEIPLEQPASAVAQKTGEISANIGQASANAGTLTANITNSNSVASTAADTARRIADEYQRAANNAASINPGNGPTPTGGDGSTPLTFADGGFVSGAGSATSDSIPAWLSNGEFVVKAAKVAKPGVLGLLRAINGGVDFPSLFGGRRRFAAGGRVGALPAVAGASDGQSVHVHFDGVSIGPMKAEKGVVDQLLREEAKRRVSSAGRAPSRVG